MTPGGLPFVAGVGARASLGGSAQAVGAAYWAGVSRQKQHPSLFSHTHTPLVAAWDPALPPDVAVERRMVELAADAAAQAIAPLVAASSRPPPVDVLVALPDVGPGIGPHVSGRVLEALAERLGPLCAGKPEAVVGGRSAGLRALEMASARLTSGESRACLWCGVDSYLAPPTLDALERAGALKHGGTRWGFVPAEAGASCLLLTGDHSAIAPLATVAAASVVADTRAADEPRAGRALTEATRNVLAALPSDQSIDHVYADLNGERDRVDDVGFTMARISNRVASLPCLTTPAARLGETGAACGPLFTALAIDATRAGRSTGPNVLIWATGPGPFSGAALLSIPVHPRAR